MFLTFALFLGFSSQNPPKNRKVLGTFRNILGVFRNFLGVFGNLPKFRKKVAHCRIDTTAYMMSHIMQTTSWHKTRHRTRHRNMNIPTSYPTSCVMVHDVAVRRHDVAWYDIGTSDYDIISKTWYDIVSLCHTMSYLFFYTTSGLWTRRRIWYDIGTSDTTSYMVNLPDDGQP